MRDGHEIVLHIYEPAGSVSTSPRVRRDGVQRSDEVSDVQGGGERKGNGKKGRPCVISFHGGGFTIGSATDDSRWAAWCTANTSSNTGTRIGTGANALFISVEYRLSPTYPHPIPLDDSIDATIHILSHPHNYGIDPYKVVLSGFSAGGNLAIATALSLPIDNTIPKLSGIISFYPVLDFHTSRLDKVGNTIDMNKKRGMDIIPRPLPGWMTRMFDTSYLPHAVDRRDPMISPLFASDEMMRRIPNIHLCLCGADTLAPEGLAFGQRLELLGSQEDREVDKDREVTVRVVEGVRDGWDKPPLPLASSVSEEYNAAVDSIKRWWA
jgi:acetyl esterase/lipase